MTFPKKYSILFLVFSCLFAGCKSAPTPPQTQTSASNAVRNNSYSLLYQLLNDEKDVSKLRFIKREKTDLKNLVKKISAVAATNVARLEEFAKQDPSLVLTNYNLPPGEEKTRKAISSTEEKELLHNSGDKFELTLFLTQIEALNYASHLAKVAGENDFNPERARVLATMSAEMKNLYDEVFERLALRQPSAPIRQ